MLVLILMLKFVVADVAASGVLLSLDLAGTSRRNFYDVPSIFPHARRVSGSKNTPVQPKVHSLVVSMGADLFY